MEVWWQLIHSRDATHENPLKTATLMKVVDFLQRLAKISIKQMVFGEWSIKIKFVFLESLQYILKLLTKFSFSRGWLIFGICNSLCNLRLANMILTFCCIIFYCYLPKNSSSGPKKSRRSTYFQKSISNPEAAKIQRRKGRFWGRPPPTLFAPLMHGFHLLHWADIIISSLLFFAF